MSNLIIGGFNEALNNIASSYLEFGDDSMSAISLLMTEKGDLPRSSYIFCKPEPLGTEFKTVACSVTGSLLFIEL